ncbi:hypothetical protein ARMGADRAFT_1068605 [Armillaria gallica]|uniref:Uncharacterized protein n=1 Tax=Armillaria gallica TaxID=47427 RepID=A0A2H3CHB6_ARMGA|nr:hypothetical protein ARMGADRAFT_1068605 [Armillaria gallica]
MAPVMCLEDEREGGKNCSHSRHFRLSDSGPYPGIRSSTTTAPSPDDIPDKPVFCEEPLDDIWWSQPAMLPDFPRCTRATRSPITSTRLLVREEDPEKEESGLKETSQLDSPAVTDVHGAEEQAPTPSWGTCTIIIWDEGRNLYQTRSSRTFEHAQSGHGTSPYRGFPPSSTMPQTPQIAIIPSHHVPSLRRWTSPMQSRTFVHVQVFWTCFATLRRSLSLCPVGRAKLSVDIDGIRSNLHYQIQDLSRFPSHQWTFALKRAPLCATFSTAILHHHSSVSTRLHALRLEHNVHQRSFVLSALYWHIGDACHPLHELGSTPSKRDRSARPPDEVYLFFYPFDINTTSIYHQFSSKTLRHNWVQSPTLDFLERTAINSLMVYRRSGLVASRRWVQFPAGEIAAHAPLDTGKRML